MFTGEIAKIDRIHISECELVRLAKVTIRSHSARSGTEKGSRCRNVSLSDMCVMMLSALGARWVVVAQHIQAASLGGGLPGVLVYIACRRTSPATRDLPGVRSGAGELWPIRPGDLGTS